VIIGVRLLRAVSPVVVLVGCALGMVWSGTPSLAASASHTTSITVQSMDSCKQTLEGAGYVLSGDNLGSPLSVSSSGSGKGSVSGGNCPVPRGRCSGGAVGCLTFTGVPVPGTYRIHAVQTPPANSSNPEGYAPCEGGSACRSEEAVVSVAADGSAQADVTDVYPDGFVRVLPGGGHYAGTADDPIVFHLFGLGSGSCDGDDDADDHLTGSPSSHCSYSPESDESSACQPYPWSCAFASTTSATSTGTTSTDSSTTTTTSTSTSSSSTTDTTTTTTTTSTSTTDSTTSSTTSTTSTSSSSTSTAPACATQATQSFTGSAGHKASTKQSVVTSATGPLSVTLSWSPSSAVELIIYDSHKVFGRTSGSTGSLTLALPSLPQHKYKVKVKNTGSPKISFTMAVTHC
jgi:hypothetical protein